MVSLKVDTNSEIPNLVNALKENLTACLKDLLLNLCSDKLLLWDVIKVAISTNIDSLFLYDAPHVNLEVFKKARQT